MSSLWKCKKHKKPKTIQKRPSPRYKNHISSLAQGLPIFPHRKFPILKKCCGSIEGISLFTSFSYKIKGSMTVEAAVVLPLFLFFFLNLGCAIELIRLHGNLELALWESGNGAALYSNVLSEPDVDKEALLQEADEEQKTSWKENLSGIAMGYFYIKYQVVNYLGEDYLNASPLSNGVESLNFLESTVQEFEDCVEIVVTYSVSPFTDMAGFRSFRMANKYYAHIWNGYRIPGTEGKEAVVYVAENGTVYHTDRGCTHLTLSIEQVSWQQACDSRNEQGRKYVACTKCCEGGTVETVYITSEGDCYHCREDCSGLKRTVLWVPISRIGDLPLCSRCAGED